MWFLLIVFLLPGMSSQSVQVLDRFETERDCVEVRDRIRYDMIEAYPHDFDFTIICRHQSKVI